MQKPLDELLTDASLAWAQVTATADPPELYVTVIQTVGPRFCSRVASSALGTLVGLALGWGMWHALHG